LFLHRTVVFRRHPAKQVFNAFIKIAYGYACHNDCIPLAMVIALQSLPRRSLSVKPDGNPHDRQRDDPEGSAAPARSAGFGLADRSRGFLVEAQAMLGHAIDLTRESFRTVGEFRGLASK